MAASNTARYPRLATVFVVWTAAAVLSYARHYLQDAPSAARVWPELLGWLACFYPWVALSPLVLRLENRFRVGRESWPRNVGVLAAASIAFSFAAAVLAGVFHLAIRVETPSFRIPPGELYFEEFLFWTVVGAGYVMRKQRESARLALDKAELEASLRQAELEVLRTRLNPHFLFNALQNISVLAEQEPRTASRMLARLGDFLRAALRRDLESEVTLEGDIGLTRSYLEVEKMRFGDRLKVVIDMAPDTRQALVPALLLQPLAENAIKHGLQGTRGGTLAIRSVRENGNLVLTVRDDGAGLPGESLEDLEIGVGLGSACDRLARMYPGRHELSVRRLSEGGTEVRVALPFRAAAAVSEDRREQPAGVDR